MTKETAAGNLSQIHLEAQLTRDYHRAEKGLALAEPRQPFGADLLRRLDALIPTAENTASAESYVQDARSARAALVAWNAGGEVDPEVAPVDGEGDRLTSIQTMFATRHSVRDFADRDVDEALLREAADLARTSPSVCNRSPWLVRFYQGTMAQEALQYQSGNGGFGHAVPAVAVVSVELGYFVGSGERNQAFIDGGIFASSLMWALHGLGLDTCMLNLSLPVPIERRLRDGLGIPASEVPIMMIAIGYGRDGHRVSRSPRRAVDKLTRVITSKD